MLSCCLGRTVTDGFKKKLVVYSRAALFGDEEFDRLARRLFDFDVPYVLTKADAVPEDWGASAVRSGDFVFRRPYGITKSKLLNLVKSKLQVALVLEVRGQHEFVLQVEGGEIELAEKLPVEAIVERGTQAEVNKLVKQVLE